MSGRLSYGVTLAVAAFQRGGITIAKAAKGRCSVSSLRRALRAAGVAPGKPGRRSQAAQDAPRGPSQRKPKRKTGRKGKR